jgi:MFS family permease
MSVAAAPAGRAVEPPEEEDHTRAAHPRLALWAMLVAAGLVMTATVIAMAALPRIGRELLASQTELQWVVDITPTVLAALVLPGGAVLDRFGRKAGLIGGFALLGAALTWSGFVSSPAELIVARFLTGVGAAIVFPGTLTTVRAITPPEGRDRAVGYWAAATLGGGTVGFLLAGLLLATPLWWGSFFVATALISFGCLVATVIAVPESRDPDPPPLDPVGALLSLIGIGGLVLGTIEIPVRGLVDPLVAGGFLVGAVALAAFVAWELRARAPMLDVRLFREPTFAWGCLALFLFFVGCYGWFLLSFQYFGYVMGYTTLGCGAAMIPNALSTVPLAAMSPRLSARWGWEPITIGSLLVLAGGAAFMAMVGDDRSVWWMAAAFFVFGIGIGCGTVAPTQAIVEALPRAKQGVASAVNDAARELGAAAGIAVMGSAFNVAYRHHIDHDARLAATAALARAVKDSPAVGLPAAGPAQVPLVREAIAAAAVSGWQAAFWTMTALFLLAALGIWWQTRGRGREAGIPGQRPAPTRAA